MEHNTHPSTDTASNDTSTDNTDTPTIRALVISPDKEPELVNIEPLVAAIEAIIGETWSLFHTDIAGVLGFVDAGTAERDLGTAPNVVTGPSQLSSPFVLLGVGAGPLGPGFLDLTSQQLEQALQIFGPQPSDSATDAPSSTPTIQVLLVAAGRNPELVTVANQPDALQSLIGGRFTMFPAGIDGTVGLSNVQAIALNLPRTYTNPTTGAHIFGTFLVVGDNADFCSLTPLQLERALQVFGPQLTHHECEQIMLTHEQGEAWVELWE